MTVDYALARKNMVDNQVRTNDVTDLRVVDALLIVPREEFVPPTQRGIAYLDMDITVGGDRFLIKPAVLARLLQAAGIKPDDRALVVGSGSGYAAAVVSHLAGQVTALECDEALASAAQARFAMGGYPNVTVVTGDLGQGHAAEAPYDVILLDGAAESVPDALCRQLSPNGCLVGVFGKHPQRGMIVKRAPSDFGTRVLFDAGAPILPGMREPAGFVF